MSIKSAISNGIESTIAVVAPIRAVKRRRAHRQMAIADALFGTGGYTGASMTRRTTAAWMTNAADADGSSLPDIPKLRERSRDMLRNMPLAAGAIKTVTQSVIGTGLMLSSTPDIEALGWTEEEGLKFAALVEREWNSWTEDTDCDATRTQNFYGIQSLAFRSALESGDVFALLPMLPKSHGRPYCTQIQIVEADRVANPTRATLDGARMESGNRVYSGVEKNALGAPVRYHILDRHPGGADGITNNKTIPYAAFGTKTGRRNVIHLFDRLRPDQSRGVPYLAPVMELFHQLGKYTDAEVQAAVVSSCFTVFVKTPAGEGAQSAGSQSGVAQDEYGNALKLESGSIVDLADGTDVSFANPGRPNTAFDAFVMSILRQIGVALGLPFEVLIKHFTASYSAARAALLEAWKFYLNRRHWFAAGFCQPIFEAWFAEAVSLGRIPAPGFDMPDLRKAYLGCEWTGDAPQSIDPVKDARANLINLQMCVTNRRTITKQTSGEPWEAVERQLAYENRKLIADGLEPPQPVKGTGGDSSTPPESDEGSDREDERKD